MPKNTFPIKIQHSRPVTLHTDRILMTSLDVKCISLVFSLRYKFYKDMLSTQNPSTFKFRDFINLFLETDIVNLKINVFNCAI